jgi:plastocyanin
MLIRCTQKCAVWGLSLAATLAAALVGCGGGMPESSDAVAIPEPNVSLTSSATAAKTAPSPSAAGTSSPASTASATPTKAEGWGTLKGQVIFGGDPPKAGVLVEQGKAAKNPEWCAKDSPILSERLVVDGATKGVKNVLVYLPRPTAVNDDAKKAASGATVLFDQTKCVFEPHVLGLMAGVQVELKSSDPLNHNVNAKLKNSNFNTTIGGGNTYKFTPASAERTPGNVVCDIHPWMSAWWMVVDHPYITVTDAKGNFEIKNAPAGTQKVVVWQEAVGFVTAPSGEDVTIKPNDTTAQGFTIDPAKVKPAS